MNAASGVRRLRHPRIYTGARGRSAKVSPENAAELLVDGSGRILSARASGKVDEVVDLPGAAVVPGFIDTHAHLTSLGGGVDDLDLRELGSPSELLALVTDAASGLAADAWITGTGWSDGVGWRGGLPTADELDRASGGRPAMLFRRDRHALLASRSAMAIAGIGATTPDPPGGEIRRDAATGEPTGLLVDSAMDALTAVVPEPSIEQVAREARSKALCLASLGVTCVHEAFVDRRLWSALARLDERRELPLRVRAMLAFDWDSAPAGERPEWLRALAIKGFADGALGSRGAQLGEPYSDGSTTGLAVQSDAELAALAERAERLGLQLAVHAIGDRGVRRVLDLFEARSGGSAADFYRSRRWRVEHAQMVRPSDLHRLEALCLAVQPVHFCEDAPWTVSRIGPDRLPWSHRWRSLVESGAVVGFGSDFPIESGDPLRAVRALVAAGHPDVPAWDRSAEGLDAQAAFDGYWARAAYLGFDDGSLGRLEPGYLADLVCLNRDPFAQNGLDELRVVATYVGGRIVYPS